MPQNEYKVTELPLEPHEIVYIKASMRIDNKALKISRLVFLGLALLYAIFIAITRITDWTFYLVPFVVLIMYIGFEINAYNSKGDLRLDLKKGVKFVLEGKITKKTLNEVTSHQMNSITTRRYYGFRVGARDFDVSEDTFLRLKEGQPVRVAYLKYSKLVLLMEFPQQLEEA